MSQELHTYVVYDIPDDRARYRIANACKDYGLARIQYSAFFGLLGHNRREELFLRIKRELGDEAGKILVLPICDRDVRARREISVAWDPMGGKPAPAQAQPGDGMPTSSAKHDFPGDPGHSEQPT